MKPPPGPQIENPTALFLQRCQELAVEVVSTLPSELGDHQEDPWQTPYGVSVAILAVAETGSLMVDSREPRLNSLAPPIHVVHLSKNRIVGTLDEAMAQLGDRNVALITGPSRTADIEGVLVRGVHGPHRVIVILED